MNRIVLFVIHIVCVSGYLYGMPENSDARKQCSKKLYELASDSQKNNQESVAALLAECASSKQHIFQDSIKLATEKGDSNTVTQLQSLEKTAQRTSWGPVKRVAFAGVAIVGAFALWAGSIAMHFSDIWERASQLDHKEDTKRKK